MAQRFPRDALQVNALVPRVSDASATRQNGVPETPCPTLTFPGQAQGASCTSTTAYASGFRLIGTSNCPKYLSNPRKGFPSLRRLPNYGRPPPARCSLPCCIFSRRLLHHISAANAGGSCSVLHGLQLPPHKRDRVRTRALLSSSLMPNQTTVPR